MKGVQCYELFGGIALKNHAFSFSFFFIRLALAVALAIVLNLIITQVLHKLVCVKNHVTSSMGLG